MTHAQDEVKQRGQHIHVDHAHLTTFYLGSSCLIPWCQLRVLLSQSDSSSTALGSTVLFLLLQPRLQPENPPSCAPCTQTLLSPIRSISTLITDNASMCMGSFTVPRQEGDASLGKHLRTLVQNSRKLRGGCKNNFIKWTVVMWNLRFVRRTN